MGEGQYTLFSHRLEGIGRGLGGSGVAGSQNFPYIFYN